MIDKLEVDSDAINQVRLLISFMFLIYLYCVPIAFNQKLVNIFIHLLNYFYYFSHEYL